MSAFPSFDDEWRKLNVSARTSESTLHALVKDLTGPSASAIQSALEELMQKYSNCQKLSVDINSHYKRSKKENLKLQAQAAVAEKSEREKKHATTKAKEYRAKVDILKKQVETLGGVVVDLDQQTVKAVKRGIDQVATKKIPDRSMLYPQKRLKNEQGDHRAAPVQLLTPTVTPPKRTSPPPTHKTAIPRAKRSDFSNSIPMGMERKFAHKRLAQPNRLFDPTKTASFATAVFQAISASMKPHQVWSDLSEKEQQGSDFPLMSNKLSKSELKKEVSEQKHVSQAKALVDFIAEAQHSHVRPLNANALQQHIQTNATLASDSIKDPVKYYKHVLDRASTTTLAHSIKAPHNFQTSCSKGHGQPAGCDSDPNVHASTSSQPVTIVTEEAWLTVLKPEYSEREQKYKGAAKRDLEGLLLDKSRDEQYTACQQCGQKIGSRLKKTWQGWAYAPDVLSFAFDRSMEKKFRVTLPLEHDFQTFVVSSLLSRRLRAATMPRSCMRRMGSGGGALAMR
ncbi:hypothetical protein CC86DRAFT_69040 [Ophiobolus disseminans]|uniref:Uncharacterized protein n=1 Tax=Ophiobolus disseminans TaxID=1469910 RepID=A0A6A6ZSC4_9PLEO|nr:hypothetical protein CC86DRAFT_69040 [Ophiobolus disseminans]